MPDAVDADEPTFLGLLTFQTLGRDVGHLHCHLYVSDPSLMRVTVADGGFLLGDCFIQLVQCVYRLTFPAVILIDPHSLPGTRQSSTSPRGSTQRPRQYNPALDLECTAMQVWRVPLRAGPFT